QAEATRDDWKKKVANYEEKKLADLKSAAEAFEAQAARKRQESHFAHAKGSRFDLGELAVEFGLVLCSVALLTKRRGFWYGGMIAAAAGALVSATVLFMSPHTEAHAAQSGGTISERCC